MISKNTIEVSFENIEKAKVIVDADCQVSQLYDLGCQLCAFAIQKMNELKPQPSGTVIPDEPAQQGDENVVVTNS